MLEHSHPTLPTDWYHDPDHFRRELAAIWWRSWSCVGHVSEWTVTGAWRAHALGTLRCFVVRGRDGALRAFLDTCRHRGSALCAGDAGRFPAGRIVCPYHAWSYDLDGRLLDMPGRLEPAGFDPADHGLYPVALEQWRGFVFVHPEEAPGERLTDALGQEMDDLAAWPLENLAVAHTETHDVACNWKVFWENFAECLHCPGVHPALGRLVPLYRQGFTSVDDLAYAGRADEAESYAGLREGAVTWSDSGTTDLPWFDGLGERERRAGQTFLTLWPGLFVIAHVDHVRTVQVQPLAPERIRLQVRWLLHGDTLAQEAVDIERLTTFGRRVVMEDAAICEINQRGLHNPRHRAGVLMPQEYDVLEFDNWVRERLGEPTAGPALR